MSSKEPFEHRTNEITYEELRELDSFKQYSEEQAKQLIETMKTFARIVYNISARELEVNKVKKLDIPGKTNTAA